MLIYGLHACENAAKSGRQIFKIFISKGKLIPDWIGSQYKRYVNIIENLSEMLPQNAVHQGIAMEVEETANCDITTLRYAEQNCIVAILDGVTDPQNFGAIIRSAAGFGVTAMIISSKTSCKVNGTVAKAASGGLEFVSIIEVTNLTQAIKKLKEYGFWIVAFSEHGEKQLSKIDLTGKICLIFGAEGKGIRRLQMENADFVAKLPTCKNFHTLNVSASAAIAFYECVRQQR